MSSDDRRRAIGKVTSVAADRFVIEMLRTNDPVLFKDSSFPVTYSMTIGAVLVVCGVITWIAFSIFRRPILNEQATRMTRTD